MPPTSLPPIPPRTDRIAGDPRAPSEYEQLRNHLGRPPAQPRIEHPAPCQRPPVPPRAAAAAPASRVPVMDWLVSVGRAVVRRVRRAPPSAMVPLHPPK